MHQQTTAEVCTQGGEAIVEEITEETDHWVNVFSLNNCSYGEGLHIHTFTGECGTPIPNNRMPLTMS